MRGQPSGLGDGTVIGWRPDESCQPQHIRSPSLYAYYNVNEVHYSLPHAGVDNAWDKAMNGVG